MFVDPVQLSEKDYHYSKETNQRLSYNKYFNFVNDLKFELIYFAFTTMLLLLVINFSNILLLILFMICALGQLISLKSIFSYIELRIYVFFYNKKLNRDLKKSKNYQEFKSMRKKRGFDIF